MLMVKVRYCIVAGIVQIIWLDIFKIVDVLSFCGILCFFADCSLFFVYVSPVSIVQLCPISCTQNKTPCL